MTTSEPIAVVLVRFPFTDLSATKKRPAIVLSAKAYGGRYGDVILIPLTSIDQEDESLRLSHWKESGLVKSTWVKPLVATVTESLVERELGRLHKEDAARVRLALRQMLAPFVWAA